MKTKTKQGKVKVIDALATIHNIMNEIAPSGTMEGKMNATSQNIKFVFASNGVEMTISVKEGGVK